MLFWYLGEMFQTRCLGPLWNRHNNKGVPNKNVWHVKILVEWISNILMFGWAFQEGYHAKSFQLWLKVIFFQHIGKMTMRYCQTLQKGNSFNLWFLWPIFFWLGGWRDQVISKLNFWGEDCQPSRTAFCKQHTNWAMKKTLVVWVI